MSRTIAILTVAASLLGMASIAPAVAAEREQVRAVINLISAIKMPFPEKLRNNLSRTEVVKHDIDGSTSACLRIDDKLR
jgi:hypothetical protein